MRDSDIVIWKGDELSNYVDSLEQVLPYDKMVEGMKIWAISEEKLSNVLQAHK